MPQQIIGNLDEKGFLGDFEADPQILKIVQTFDPPGIAARNLQESLLIQLKIQKKEDSLAYFYSQTILMTCSAAASLIWLKNSA